MAGVWLAFFVLASFQACGEVAASVHGTPEIRHRVPDSHEGLHHDFCCQLQISSHDVFPNFSLSANGNGLYKLAILLFLPIAFLLPGSGLKSGPVRGFPAFSPPRSNPFLSTIRLLI